MAGNCLQAIQPCACSYVAINVCNYNKWSGTPHLLTLNGNALTQPTIHVDGACGGGYYSNVSPLPGYCGLGFLCCGSQVGGDARNISACGCGGTPACPFLTAGIYPATGAANEDCCATPKSSNAQTCGTLGDCSGDLITQVFPSSYLVKGTNTMTLNETGTARCAGSFGCVQVKKLNSGGSVLSTLLNTTYTAGANTYTFTL